MCQYIFVITERNILLNWNIFLIPDKNALRERNGRPIFINAICLASLTQPSNQSQTISGASRQFVIYWPSTKPSIKRCTCVNKRKSSGSRYTLSNNITRCPDGASQLETRCRSESQQQTEGFGPSVTHGWATPTKMKKKCCYSREKNLGRYSSLSLSPAPFSHTTNITLSKIKCGRLYFL